MSLRHQIGITLIKGIGPVLAKNLIAYLGDVEAVFTESQTNLAKIPEIGPVLSKQIVDQDVLARADKEIDFIEKNNIQALFYADKNYPYRLKECVDAPVIVYFKGNSDFNASRFVGMVGTRKASDYGKELCDSFVKDLAAISPNTYIVSGLAYGVDICSHKAALQYNLPTIAALGHGLDKIYPATHRATAVKMLEQGGLITEYMSQTNPDRQNFVQRNRLIAGLCDAVLVVESADKGGSLITTEFAGSYNRDVFAFPGRVGDVSSAGCNNLIKQNKAALIESAADFLKAMNWESKQGHSEPVQSSLFIDLNDGEQRVVDCLRTEDVLSMNQIALLLAQTVSKTSAMLLEMEFKGLVKCMPGNNYKLRV